MLVVVIVIMVVRMVVMIMVVMVMVIVDVGHARRGHDACDDGMGGSEGVGELVRARLAFLEGLRHGGDERAQVVHEGGGLLTVAHAAGDTVLPEHLAGGDHSLGRLHHQLRVAGVGGHLPQMGQMIQVADDGPRHPCRFPLRVGFVIGGGMGVFS